MTMVKLQVSALQQVPKTHLFNSVATDILNTMWHTSIILIKVSSAQDESSEELRPSLGYHEVGGQKGWFSWFPDASIRLMGNMRDLGVIIG